MRNILVATLLLSTFFAHAQLGAFNASDQPSAPDYSLKKNWSALPFHKDEADVIPSSETWVDDSLKTVDVFYIYPTIYMSGKTWCADVNNQKLNKRIDTKPVKYQASVFNKSCRVYAPRYRQAIIKSFFTMEGEGKKALSFAYDDVKRAFKYYLEHYNHGRPIIIASHSQGSYHARRLLAEFFDTTVLKKQLVCAYVIGFGIEKTMYQTLTPCNNSSETDCYVTWASFKKGYNPLRSELFKEVCVNPVSWKCNEEVIDKSKSLGGILLSFDTKYQNGAQVHNHYLWVDNHTPFVSGWTNLHIADYNLFWFDIRQNVADRIKSYQAKR
jgi:hypothetical protein